MLPVQFLDTVLDMPVAVLRQVPGLMVQITVVRPQLQSIEGCRHFLSFSRGSSPWSRLFTRPQRFFSCYSISGGRCPCCAGSCRFSGAAVEKTLALSQLQLVEKSVPFYVPSYLAVTRSVFAFGVQDFGLFWVMTSGNVPVFSAYRFNTGYMSTSVYGGFWNIFTPSYFSAMLGSTADSCSCVRLRSLSRFTLQKTVESPQLQSIKVVDFFFMVHRQISMVLLFSRP